jgi:hypothetical protein
MFGMAERNAEEFSVSVIAPPKASRSTIAVARVVGMILSNPS